MAYVMECAADRAVMQTCVAHAKSAMHDIS